MQRRPYANSQAFNIDFGDSSSGEFTVGGFPYTGEVRATGHDGRGRPGERLAVCVRLFRDIEPVRDIFQRSPGLWSMNEGEQCCTVDIFDFLSITNFTLDLRKKTVYFDCKATRDEMKDEQF